MICMRKIKSKTPSNGFTVHITGTFTSYTKVTIGGVQYSTAQNVSVPAGTEVILYVGRRNSDYTPYIAFNSKKVINDKAGSYTFTVSSDVYIYVTGASRYGTITATMQ